MSRTENPAFKINEDLLDNEVHDDQESKQNKGRLRL
jgi:hypothetical protein